MAMAIKGIPVLKDKTASLFVKKAERVFNNSKGSVNFQKEIDIANKILAKSRKK